MRELVGRGERLGTILRKLEVEGNRRLFRTEQEVACSERNVTTLFFQNYMSEDSGHIPVFIYDLYESALVSHQNFSRYHISCFVNTATRQVVLEYSEMLNDSVDYKVVTSPWDGRWRLQPD